MKTKFTIIFLKQTSYQSSEISVKLYKIISYMSLELTKSHMGGSTRYFLQFNNLNLI